MSDEGNEQSLFMPVSLVLGSCLWVHNDRCPGRRTARPLPAQDHSQVVPLPVWSQSQDPTGYG